jgi:hypothetical protein
MSCAARCDAATPHGGAAALMRAPSGPLTSALPRFVVKLRVRAAEEALEQPLGVRDAAALAPAGTAAVTAPAQARAARRAPSRNGENGAACGVVACARPCPALSSRASRGQFAAPRRTPLPPLLPQAPCAVCTEAPKGAPLACAHCAFSACAQCYKRYFSDHAARPPACMACRKLLSADNLRTAFSEAFVTTARARARAAGDGLLFALKRGSLV